MSLKSADDSVTVAVVSTFWRTRIDSSFIAAFALEAKVENIIHEPAGAEGLE